MKTPDYEKATELLIDKVDKLREQIVELNERLEEEFSRGVKEGLNQAAEIVKNC